VTEFQHGTSEEDGRDLKSDAGFQNGFERVHSDFTVIGVHRFLVRCQVSHKWLKIQ
jgi:hypothetical protein